MKIWEQQKKNRASLVFVIHDKWSSVTPWCTKADLDSSLLDARRHSCTFQSTFQMSRTSANLNKTMPPSMLNCFPSVLLRAWLNIISILYKKKNVTQALRVQLHNCHLYSGLIYSFCLLFSLSCRPLCWANKTDHLAFQFLIYSKQVFHPVLDKPYVDELIHFLYFKLRASHLCFAADHIKNAALCSNGQSLVDIVLNSILHHDLGLCWWKRRVCYPLQTPSYVNSSLCNTGPTRSQTVDMNFTPEPLIHAPGHTNKDFSRGNHFTAPIQSQSLRYRLPTLQ